MLKRIRQFRGIQARSISTASSPYDNYTKLRALPFLVPPEEAQKLLAPWAAMTCDLGKIWPSLFSHPPSFLNLNFLRPARFSAVYFPAWFVTGEVEARITYKGFQLKERAWFHNTYLPGSHLAVLSAAPLSIPSLKETETVPFTTSLLHQHGEPVQCIPFTTSPFSILDIAASHPSRSITISEDLSIDPSSVKPNLISAYPVLLPLYLAQYEIQGQKDNANNMFTFILKANKHGFDTIMCENLSRIDIRVRKAIEQSVERIGIGLKSSGEVYSFLTECPRVSIPEISLPQQKTIKNSLSGWLEELLRSSRNIEILAERSLGVIGKGDEDLRIREMTSEEEASLKKYAGITATIMLLKRQLMTLIALERTEIKGSDLTLSDLLKKIEENIKKIEADRAEMAPEWWSEWLALNRPESEITKSHGLGGDENVTDGTRPPPKDSDNLKAD